MKKLFSSIVGLSLCIGAAEARLGESLEKVRERYGKEYNKKVVDGPISYTIYYFKQKNHSVAASIGPKDKCFILSYYDSSVKLTKEDLMKMMVVNFGVKGDPAKSNLEKGIFRWRVKSEDASGTLHYNPIKIWDNEKFIYRKQPNGIISVMRMSEHNSR